MRGNVAMAMALAWHVISESRPLSNVAPKPSALVGFTMSRSDDTYDGRITDGLID